jgi:fumarylacetoacetase
MSTQKSFIEYEPECEFSIQNCPYGIYSTAGNETARIGVAIGDQVLDLTALSDAGLFAEMPDGGKCLTADLLNPFMAAGKGAWDYARGVIQRVLDADNAELRDNAALRAAALSPLSGAKMHMPARVGDYTDFYSSREHATNVGTMFRPDGNPLLPNWLHLPVGYHGRSSTVILSGVDVKRPNGQLQVSPTDPTQGSTYGPCRLCDFELEIGAFVGPGNEMGDTIDITEADDHVFGLVLLNDWSARDIQKWEYVPLGPFTAKNWATSISPWVVPTAAFKEFECPTSAGVQDPKPLPYLQDPNYTSYDIKLSVSIQGHDTSAMKAVTNGNFNCLYWNVRQQLTHHSVTGCNMQPGDLLGSGTISGPTPDSYGSMLELSWKGTKTVDIGEGKERKFIQDGDTVRMDGYCQGDGFRVGFGGVENKLLAANKPK